MSLDLDPVYHTTTMVKILRDQGCSQHAMELAETILAHGENAIVRGILEELKTEAKQAFERFKHGGRSVEREPRLEAEKTVSEDEEVEGEPREEPHLTLVANSPEDPNSPPLARLQELLQRIERNRLRS